MVIWWATITLSLEIPVLIFIGNRVRKTIKFLFPYYETVKYCGATLAFIIVFSFTNDFIIEYHISIYDFLPGLFLQLGICVSIYLGITYIIDKKTRNLFAAIIQEFVRKK